MMQQSPTYQKSLCSKNTSTLFNRDLYQFFKKNNRDLPWRKNNTPYQILVSEVMLQQTQVDRVCEKFLLFMQTFPTIESLASATLAEVLTIWSGLGYNRRAKMLLECAQNICTNFKGKVPETPEELITLPGIGKATSASIAVFAFNKPYIFIETNIRAVFIHHFFNDRIDIPDADIIPLIEMLIDRKNPCKWYSALMDYGTILKKSHPNPSRKSRHHVKQSPFEGSKRKLRGAILKALLEKGMTSSMLLKKFENDNRTEEILEDLTSEGFIKKSGTKYIVR